jgi:hypothetical protein
MDQVQQLLQRLKPLFDEVQAKKLDSIYAKYKTADFEDRKHIEEIVAKIATKHGLTSVDDRIILPPPDAHMSEGDLSLGTIKYLDKDLHEFKLNKSELTRHLGIFGSTGTGKTTLARHLIKELTAAKVPIMIFDWETSYRTLLADIPDIKVFTVGKDIAPFRFNFFRMPPGIATTEYIKEIIEVFRKAYVGGVGSDTILKRVFDQAYKENRLPTLAECKRIMDFEMTPKKMRGRTMLWKESAGRMLEFLLYGATGDMFNRSHRIPFEDLFSSSVIFELGGLANVNDKRFFVEMLTLWYWLYKEHEGIEDEHLKHVIIFEEFHNIVANSDQDDFIHKAFRQLRKYGTGLVAIDQTPSLITTDIFENMGTKVSFSLDHAKNVRAVASSMFMDRDQVNFFGLLGKGEAIVRVKERCPYPFLVKCPFTGKATQVTDDMIRKAMKEYSDLSPTSVQEFDNQTPLRTSPQSEYTPSPQEKILLQDVANNPFRSTNERYKALGFSARMGNEFKSKLADAGFISPVQVDRKVMIELTDRGRNSLEKSGFKVPRQARGGLEHNYALYQIKELFKSKEGFPFTEKDDIDLVVEHYDSKTLVQVETGKSNIKKNIDTILAAKGDRRIMVATNPAALHKIQELITTSDHPSKSSIQTYLIKDFISQNPLS